MGGRRLDDARDAFQRYLGRVTERASPSRDAVTGSRDRGQPSGPEELTGKTVVAGHCESPPCPIAPTLLGHDALWYLDLEDLLDLLVCTNQ